MQLYSFVAFSRTYWRTTRLKFEPRASQPYDYYPSADKHSMDWATPPLTTGCAGAVLFNASCNEQVFSPKSWKKFGADSAFHQLLTGWKLVSGFRKPWFPHLQAFGSVTSIFGIKMCAFLRFSRKRQDGCTPIFSGFRRKQSEFLLNLRTKTIAKIASHYGERVRNVLRKLEENTCLLQPVLKRTPWFIPQS